MALFFLFLASADCLGSARVSGVFKLVRAAGGGCGYWISGMVLNGRDRKSLSKLF